MGRGGWMTAAGWVAGDKPERSWGCTAEGGLRGPRRAGRLSGRVDSRTGGWTWGGVGAEQLTAGGGGQGVGASVGPGACCWAKAGLRDQLRRGSQLCPTPRDPCSVSENVILSGRSGVFCRRTFRDSSGQLCHLNECQLVAPLFPVRGRQQRAASWSPHARPPFPARPGSLGSPPDPSASSHHPSEAARQAEPSSECAQAQTGGPAPPLLLAKCISASQLCDPGLGLGIC